MAQRRALGGGGATKGNGEGVVGGGRHADGLQGEGEVDRGWERGAALEGDNGVIGNKVREVAKEGGRDSGWYEGKGWWRRVVPVCYP